MTTIVNQVAALAKTTNVATKRKLSRELSIMLSKDEDYSILALQTVAYGIMKQSALLSPIMDEELFKLRHAPYKDIDGVTRVAWGVAFLQDYLAPDETLDSRMAAEMYALILEANLELVVNDISVNTVHLRNGEVAHGPQEEA